MQASGRERLSRARHSGLARSVSPMKRAWHDRDLFVAEIAMSVRRRVGNRQPDHQRKGKVPCED